MTDASLHPHTLARLWLPGMHIRAVTFAGSSALKQVPLCFPTSPGSACFLCPLLLFPLPGGWGPSGCRCHCPSPWRHPQVLQHTLGFCCLPNRTEDERVAVPTPPGGQQGGTTGLCQMQEATPGQMSPVSLEAQQEVFQ